MRIKSLNYTRAKALISSIISVFLLGACTHHKEDAEVKIDFSALAQLKNSASSQSVNDPVLSKMSGVKATGSGAGNGDGWNTTLNPTTLAELSCIGIFVGGPDAELQVNAAYSPDKLKKMSFGPWVASLPIGLQASQTVSFKLRPGPARMFYLVGWKATSAAECKDFHIDEPNSNNLSQPFVIGSAKADLSSGSMNLSISASMNGSYALDEFVGRDFNDGGSGGGGGPKIPVYGTGADGDINITADTNFSVATKDNRLISASNRVKEISDDGRILSLKYNQPDQFRVGDEILFYVTAANAIPGQTGVGPDNICGNLYRGRYEFARIAAVGPVLGVLKLALDRPMIKSALNANEKAALAADSISGSFCRIQVVRVPNFNIINVQFNSTATNLTINTNSLSPVSAVQMEFGGILAFRAKKIQVLGFDGTNTLKLNMSGAGFSGGLLGFQALGTQGESPGGSAGYSTGNPYSGGSGGGNFFSGGNGNSSVANSIFPGGAANSFCMNNSSCLPLDDYKMFMGGGGGGAFTTPNYGAGGGIIIAAVKEIRVTAASLQVLAEGGNGFSFGNPYGGDGGGAGGSIALLNSSIDYPGVLTLSTAGGDGGAGSGTSYAGGGGSPGPYSFKTCNGIGSTIMATDSSGGGGGMQTGAYVGAAAASLTLPAFGLSPEACEP